MQDPFFLLEPGMVPRHHLIAQHHIVVSFATDGDREPTQSVLAKLVTAADIQNV